MSVLSQESLCMLHKEKSNLLCQNNWEDGWVLPTRKMTGYLPRGCKG
uniref:Uncharacterized protein n=1 Tax=Anguilla anguilla TaxID=7936 RepID=A0A0E9RZK7_ANGAN